MFLFHTSSHLKNAHTLSLSPSSPFSVGTSEGSRSLSAFLHPLVGEKGLWRTMKHFVRYPDCTNDTLCANVIQAKDPPLSIILSPFPPFFPLENSQLCECLFIKEPSDVMTTKMPPPITMKRKKKAASK